MITMARRTEPDLAVDTELSIHYFFSRGEQLRLCIVEQAEQTDPAFLFFAKLIFFVKNEVAP